MVGTGLCVTLAGVVVFFGSHIPRLLPASLGFTSCVKTNMWNKLISAFNLWAKLVTKMLLRAKLNLSKCQAFKMFFLTLCFVVTYFSFTF